MRFVFWLALVGAALPAVGTSPVTAAPAPHRWRRTRLLADCYPVSFCVTHGLMPAPDAALKKLAARVIAERKRAALTGDSGLPPIDEIGGQISEFPPPSWQGSSVSQQEEVAALAHSSASVGFEGGAGAKRWRAEWAAAHPRTAHGKADLARQKAAVAEQRRREWQAKAVAALVAPAEGAEAPPTPPTPPATPAPTPPATASPTRSPTPRHTTAAPTVAPTPHRVQTTVCGAISDEVVSPWRAVTPVATEEGADGTGGGGLYMDIKVSHCAFHAPPLYFATLLVPELPRLTAVQRAEKAGYSTAAAESWLKTTEGTTATKAETSSWEAEGARVWTDPGSHSIVPLPARWRGIADEGSSADDSGFRVLLTRPGVTQLDHLQEARRGNWKVSWVAVTGTASGVTVTHKTGWRATARGALFVDVSTGSAGFAPEPAPPPRYFVALHGRSASSHWRLGGAHVVYYPRATGFRVYVTLTECVKGVCVDKPAAAEDAEREGWRVAWFGVEDAKGWQRDERGQEVLHGGSSGGGDVRHRHKTTAELIANTVPAEYKVTDSSGADASGQCCDGDTAPMTMASSHQWQLAKAVAVPGGVGLTTPGIFLRVDTRRSAFGRTPPAYLASAVSALARSYATNSPSPPRSAEFTPQLAGLMFVPSLLGTGVPAPALAGHRLRRCASGGAWRLFYILGARRVSKGGAASRLEGQLPRL